MTSLNDRVVPNSLNYVDIKPESIESEIKLVRFTPTQTITGARGGDMIKFLLTGQGFFDPYSSYFQFDVEVDNFVGTPVKFLDRSAHSFIQRMVIRSQGTEIERIENYDIIAGMINDLIYSPEQNATHQWEGFPTQQLQVGESRSSSGSIDTRYTQVPCEYALGAPGSSVALTAPLQRPRITERAKLGQLFGMGCSPIISKYVGETTFAHDILVDNEEMASSGGATNVFPIDSTYVRDTQVTAEGSPVDISYGQWEQNNLGTQGLVPSLTPLEFAHHNGGIRVPASYATDPATQQLRIPSSTKYRFMIPIYSGLIGLLMPDKKLLPLNLLPLDIEIVLNPHALYASHGDGNRAYTISNFYMYANMIFFEQEVHRSLEAGVAEHGLFIYCNSFHSAPQQLIGTKNVPVTSHISMNLKSINSVHVVFLYNHFETQSNARKLHFVSHNLTSLQLLNGTTLLPQYAIEGHAGTSKSNMHVPFLLEMLRAWNKMHDPNTDTAIQPYNYCGDEYAGQFGNLYLDLRTRVSSVLALQSIVNRQAGVGRCQYGISLEGEELGTDKTMITGRKSQYPFLLQMQSSGKLSAHTSYQYTFLRADFIVYIRPDLQIVTLGK